MLVFSLLLFVAHMKERRSLNWLDKALLWVTSPIQHAIVWSIDGVAGLWNDYVYLVGVREENKELKLRLEELVRQNARLAEVEAQNERLRKLINLKETLGDRPIVAARVIGVSTSPVSRTIRLNAGESQGIKVGDAVMAEGGLVGRITGVTSGYSQVRMIVDGSSAVDIIIQRSRARGIVRGQGEDEECSVDYVVRTADVEIEDVAVTSGIGGVFPAGILVGTITSVTSPSAGVFRAAKLEPAVEFQTLEEVVVVFSSSNRQSGVEE